MARRHGRRPQSTGAPAPKPPAWHSIPLVEDVDGQAYAELIAFCSSLASRALLVERPRGATLAGLELLARLRPFEVERRESNEWPSTRHGGRPSTLHFYRVCRELQLALTAAQPGLFQWDNALEDLSFEMKDGRWLLISTTHEGIAHLELNEGERAFLASHYPTLEALLGGPPRRLLPRNHPQ